jgi:hypothetical protein
MTELHDWLNDSDGDGIPDNVNTLLILDLPEGEPDREFWSVLLNVSATLGLHCAALPFPIVLASPDHSRPENLSAVTIKSRDDIQSMLPLRTGELPAARSENGPASSCLTTLFTPDGALLDEDGDLVADGTRITFDLPETLPSDVGAALANLTARVGLESGGLSLPLVGTGLATFSVRLSADPASLVSTDDGWLASGTSDDLAALLNQIAEHWPHVTSPETGGVASSLGWLRRSLAGDGPEPRALDELEWELQWSARREVDQIWSALVEQVLPQLDSAQPVTLTIMACEPVEDRQRLEHRVEGELRQRGFPGVQIQTVCSFKSGLSWLRETVIPALKKSDASSVHITYRRFHADSSALDRPTRWLQELFPGNEVIANETGIPLEAIKIVEVDDGPTFSAEGFTQDGTSVGVWHFSPLHRTIPFVSAIDDSGTVCVTTSGLIAEQGDRHIEIPVRSDLETFWWFWQDEIIPRLIDQIDAAGGAHTTLQPFFGRLEADVWMSAPNSRLGIREENDSAAEALHEDIYFNTLDAIEMYGQRETGERTSAPGAVVPVVHVQPGVTPHARVRLFSAPTRPDLPYPELMVRGLSLRDDEFVLDVVVEGATAATARRLIDLAGMSLPQGPTIPARVSIDQQTVELRLPVPQLLTAGNAPPEPPAMRHNIHGAEVEHITASLSQHPDVTAWVEDTSYEGRPMIAMALAPATPGRLRSPAKLSALKPTCLIVARHHANEISSTNAAFQLAHLCATDPEWQAILQRVNVVILPYENPDGAALHARLTSDPDTRTWKHHPARYNSLGYEFSEAFFDPDTRFGESRPRPALWKRFLPDAIVDNHGVPSHEWVQPFAGFGSPPRFRVSYWIPQALLYGIIGYVDSEDYPEHHDAAIALRETVSAAVRDTDIGDLNRIIGDSYRFWGQDRDPESFPGEFHNDMLWHISGAPPSATGRGFATRYPATTVLNWVTEVNDETAEAEHLERTARANLIANRAMLDLIGSAAERPEPTAHEDGGRLIYRWHRKRPLKIGCGRDHGSN